MHQELRETVDAVMADELKLVQDILNKHPTGDYWILMHHKPVHRNLQRTDKGQSVVRRVIKRYTSKPSTQLGTVVFTVKDGEIVDTEVTLHDIPIDTAKLLPIIGDPDGIAHVESRPEIARNYIYNVQ